MQEISVIQGFAGEDAPSNSVFGKKIGFFWRLFGCAHRNLSRPFTKKEIGYRSCLECGARKRFDTDSLKTFRSYYYPPEIEN